MRLHHRLQSVQHRLDSLNKSPKHLPAAPPRVSSHSTWLSASEQPVYGVLLCSISSKSLAGKRFVAGVFWLSEGAARAFPVVRESRGAGAVPTHTESCCGPGCTAPQTQTVPPGRGSDDRGLLRALSWFTNINLCRNHQQ